MFDKEYLYDKFNKHMPFTDEECEWLTYYESLISRTDKDHEKDTDPLVGAALRDANHIVRYLSHRASGQEGNHAEYTLFIEQASGIDLTGYELFTTLEPCVDDVRSSIGASCSSIIAKSEVKKVHIGIFDPNPQVCARGYLYLYINGIDLCTYSAPGIREKITNSCEVFKNQKLNETKDIQRFFADVLPKFDKDALKKYLEDCYLYNKGNLDGFDLNEETTLFVKNLLNKKYVSFKARDIYIEDEIKILFFKKDFLDYKFDRQIKIRSYKNSKIDSGINTLDIPLPSLFLKLESRYRTDNDETNIILREVVANLIIHRSYASTDGVAYIREYTDRYEFENHASKNIDNSNLEKLVNFTASSIPGNSIIADFFDKAGYCERFRKGQSTFSGLKNVVSISLKDKNVIAKIKLL